MSIDKKIDYLTAELIQELGTMEIEEIQEFRIEVMRELDTFKRPELVKVYINRLIDLVIQKKQEERGQPYDKEKCSSESERNQSPRQILDQLRSGC